MQVVGGFFPYQEEREGWLDGGQERGMVMVKDSALIGKSSVKMDALLEDLEEVADETKVIVWAHFVSELKLIAATLKAAGYSCCLYYGGTPSQERRQIIEDFKAGKYKVFVGNAATAGFGLNLQNATLQYYYSNTFRTEERLQAEDRSHRIGVKSSVVYKDIIAKGTIDERIAQNTKVGRDLNDYFKQNSLMELLTDEEEDEA